MILHHVSVGTNDLDRAQLRSGDGICWAAPYQALRRLLGYGLTEIIFSIERPVDGKRCGPGNGTHVAFHAGHRNTGDDFHRIGVAGGGSDVGALGIRDDYDRHYYAAIFARSGRQQDRGCNFQQLIILVGLSGRENAGEGSSDASETNAR